MEHALGLHGLRGHVNRASDLHGLLSAGLFWCSLVPADEDVVVLERAVSVREGALDVETAVLQVGRRFPADAGNVGYGGFDHDWTWC